MSDRQRVARRITPARLARRGGRLDHERSAVPRLLTTRELAAATGLSRWGIYELVAQGKGPPMLRWGKHYRFPEDQVAQWIREQSSPGGGR